MTNPTETAAQALQIVVFEVAGACCAFPAGEVRRVAPMCRLSRPPGLPDVLEGLLNLGGQWVPILSARHVLGRLAAGSGGGQGEQGAEVPLVDQHLLLFDAKPGIHGLRVKRVKELRSVPRSELREVDKDATFNGVCVARLTGAEEVYLLSPGALLLAAERERTEEFRRIEQERLQRTEAAR